MPLPLVPIAVAAVVSGGLSLGADALLSPHQAWSVGRVLGSLGVGAVSGVVGVLLGPKLLAVVGAALLTVGVGLAVRILGNLLRGRRWSADLSPGEVTRSFVFAALFGALCWAVFRAVPALRPRPGSLAETPPNAAPEPPPPRPSRPAPEPPTTAPAPPPPPPRAAPTEAAPPSRGARGALLGEPPAHPGEPSPRGPRPGQQLPPEDELEGVLRDWVELRRQELQPTPSRRYRWKRLYESGELGQAYIRSTTPQLAAQAKRLGLEREAFISQVLGDLEAIVHYGAAKDPSLRAQVGVVFDATPAAAGPRVPAGRVREAFAHVWLRQMASWHRLMHVENADHVYLAFVRGLEAQGVHSPEPNYGLLDALAQRCAWHERATPTSAGLKELVERHGLPLLSGPGRPPPTQADQETALRLLAEYVSTIRFEGLPPP